MGRGRGFPFGAGSMYRRELAGCRCPGPWMNWWARARRCGQGSCSIPLFGMPRSTPSTPSNRAPSMSPTVRPMIGPMKVSTSGICDRLTSSIVSWAIFGNACNPCPNTATRPVWLSPSTTAAARHRSPGKVTVVKSLTRPTCGWRSWAPTPRLWVSAVALRWCDRLKWPPPWPRSSAKTSTPPVPRRLRP